MDIFSSKDCNPKRVQKLSLLSILFFDDAILTIDRHLLLPTKLEMMGLTMNFWKEYRGSLCGVFAYLCGMKSCTNVQAMP